MYFDYFTMASHIYIFILESFYLWPISVKPEIGYNRVVGTCMQAKYFLGLRLTSPLSYWCEYVGTNYQRSEYQVSYDCSVKHHHTDTKTVACNSTFCAKAIVRQVDLSDGHFCVKH